MPLNPLNRSGKSSGYTFRSSGLRLDPRCQGQKSSRPNLILGVRPRRHQHNPFGHFLGPFQARTCPFSGAELAPGISFVYPSHLSRTYIRNSRGRRMREIRVTLLRSSAPTPPAEAPRGGELCAAALQAASPTSRVAGYFAMFTAPRREQDRCCAPAACPRGHTCRRPATHVTTTRWPRAAETTNSWIYSSPDHASSLA